MLAIADQHGEVNASIPGLARIAGVSIQACEAAISTLLAPDPYSRTKDDEGRRIEAIDGGWELLNHAKYRELATGVEKSASHAQRQKRYRERQKRNTVTHRDATVTHRDARETVPVQAEAEAVHRDIARPEPTAECAIEPPHGFPKTEQEARQMASMIGVDEVFAVDTYHKAVSRGYKDAKQILIANFSSYLKIEAKYQTNREAEKNHANTQRSTPNGRPGNYSGPDRNRGQIIFEGNDYDKHVRRPGKVVGS